MKNYPKIKLEDIRDNQSNQISNKRHNNFLCGKT